jgi:membrane fusion protein (multidrug efflux system)
VIAVALLGAVIYAFIRWEKGGHAAPQAGGPAAAAGAVPPMPVSVIEIAEQRVPLIPSYLGRTEASQTVEIRARVSGFLEALQFEEGTAVTTGQPLYLIDPKPFEAELAVANARVVSAEASLAAAERLVARVARAAQNNAASTNEIDEAQTQQTIAQSELRLARAQLVQAELDLSYTRITSPIDGIIGLSLKDVGSYLQPGETGLLATVQQLDPLYVVFSISEQVLLRWQKMMESGEVSVPEMSQIPVLLRLADGSLFSIPGPDGTRTSAIGRLNFQSMTVDPTTGTALFRAEFPNPEATVRPGQIVRVTTHGIVRTGAVLVPQRAVISTPAGSSVYVVTDKDGVPTAVARPVELGEWYGDNWVITSGLSRGDRVIVDKIAQVRPGAPVAPNVVPAPAATPDDVPPPPQPATTSTASTFPTRRPHIQQTATP